MSVILLYLPSLVLGALRLLILDKLVFISVVSQTAAFHTDEHIRAKIIPTELFAIYHLFTAFVLYT